MNQHKWHKEIKAWADGAEIEVRHKTFNNADWEDVKDPMWLDDVEYRIKPQPKEPQYLGVAILTDGRIILFGEGQLIPLSKGQSVHKIIGKIPLIVERNNDAN